MGNQRETVIWILPERKTHPPIPVSSNSPEAPNNRGQAFAGWKKHGAFAFHQNTTWNASRISIKPSIEKKYRDPWGFPFFVFPPGCGSKLKSSGCLGSFWFHLSHLVHVFEPQPTAPPPPAGGSPEDKESLQAGQCQACTSFVLGVSQNRGPLDTS